MKISFKLFSIFLLPFVLISCWSKTSESSNNPGTDPSTPTPIPPPMSVSCRFDISQTMSNLRYFPNNPLRANSMIIPLNQAKSVLVSIANDPNCSVEAQQVSEALRSYWQAWINLDYQKDLILADGNRIQCRSGCTAFSSGSSEGCKQQCENDYRSVLSSLESEKQSNTQEMNSFFGSR